MHAQGHHCIENVHIVLVFNSIYSILSGFLKIHNNEIIQQILYLHGKFMIHVIAKQIMQDSHTGNNVCFILLSLTETAKYI